MSPYANAAASWLLAHTWLLLSKRAPECHERLKIGCEQAGSLLNNGARVHRAGWVHGALASHRAPSHGTECGRFFCALGGRAEAEELGFHWDGGAGAKGVFPGGDATCAVCDPLLCALPPGTAGMTSSWHPVHREPACQAGRPPAAASSWPMVRNPTGVGRCLLLPPPLCAEQLLSGSVEWELRSWC